MARYTTTATSSWDRETAFDYLADFSSVSDWDPGAAESECVTGPALSEGAHFDVEVETIAGRTSTFDYETIEIERPERVVLRAETGVLVSEDTMTFVETGDGTEVTYDAKLNLKGPLKLVDPLLSLAFNRIGDKARDGLRKRLAGPPPARTS